ncbi:interleukin-34 isoform X2 [Denticeps clupeoides]|uniref:interleukin-34 isoform X2 n=1 Tax=Denticeps clupeoides TaxID=299321 RepID=UPI0010A4BA12|nr:interleukin-34 isoform X2 [Denticeps clupeoides]
MVRSSAWNLGALLGLLLALPVWMSSTPPDLCKALNTVKSSLSLANRLRYMKQNFPINYTIRVHYEEVFKLKNISRLRRKVEGLVDGDLQETWLRVNLGVLKKIKVVLLPGKHPSSNYTSNLHKLFLNVEQIYPSREDPPERIQRIWDVLASSTIKEKERATPKSLLDSCYQTMHCLFSDCFPRKEGEPDYCLRAHWRGEKRTKLQKA